MVSQYGDQLRDSGLNLLYNGDAFFFFSSLNIHSTGLLVHGMQSVNAYMYTASLNYDTYDVYSIEEVFL